MTALPSARSGRGSSGQSGKDWPGEIHKTKPHGKDRVKSVSLQKHADARQQNQVNHHWQVIPGRENTIADVINGGLDML